MELKITLVVEGMCYSGTGHGAGLVQVKLAPQALVLEAYSSFFTAITIEWDFCVFKLELVVWMDGVRDFFVKLHGALFFWPI